jgi:hypothetical protein
MALIPRYRLAVDRWIAVEPKHIGIERGDHPSKQGLK